MHLYHILYNLYRKNIVIDQFKKIVEWKFLKKVTMVTSNQKSSKQGPPLKLNFNMGQFSSLFSEFWLLGSFLAIFSKKLEFCTSRQTFFKEFQRANLTYFWNPHILIPDTSKSDNLAFLWSPLLYTDGLKNVYSNDFSTWFIIIWSSKSSLHMEMYSNCRHSYDDGC